MRGQTKVICEKWLVRGKPSNFATHSLEFIERGLLKTKHIPETSCSENLRVSGRPTQKQRFDYILGDQKLEAGHLKQHQKLGQSKLLLL